jgi:hypothetical protein
LPENDPERTRLDRKATALFFAHGWHWFGRPTQPAGWRSGWHDLFRQFRRGTLSELRIPARLAHLIADLPALFVTEPVETITFECVGVRADHLRAVRRLAIPPRPVRLQFRRTHTNGDSFGYVTTALDSPLASAARAVDASGCGVGSPLAFALSRSLFLGTLQELILDGNRLDAFAAVALVCNRKLAPLEVLSLRGNSFSPAALAMLHERFGDRLTV